jgi:hypothetical protein
MTTKQLVLTSLLTACTLAGGWAIGHFGLAPHSTPTIDSNPTPAATKTIAKPSAKVTIDSLHAIPELLERETAELRWVEQASEEELREVLAQLPASESLRSAAMLRWAEINPAGAFAFYNGLGLLDRMLMENYHNVAGLLLREWARQDPVKAMAAARSVSHRAVGVLANARWDVIAATMETNLEQGLALAADDPTLDPKNSRIPPSMWSEDPARFVRALGNLSTRNVQNTMLTSVRQQALTDWAKKDFAAAVAFVGSLPSQDAIEMLNHVLAPGQADPAAARAAWEALPTSFVKDRAGLNIVSAMAATDPSAAMDWLQTHLSSARNEGFATLIRTCATRGIEGAQQLLEKIPPGSGRDHAVAALAQTWARMDRGQGVADAAPWLLSLPVDKAQQSALAAISQDWAKSDLTNAAKFVAAGPEGSVPNSLVWNTARQYVEQDPSLAFSWAKGLPADRAGNAITCVIAQTVDKDLDQGTGMASTLPPGPLRQAALASVLETVEYQSEPDLDALATALAKRSLYAEANKLIAQGVLGGMKPELLQQLQSKLKKP